MRRKISILGASAIHALNPAPSFDCILCGHLSYSDLDGEDNLHDLKQQSSAIKTIFASSQRAKGPREVSENGIGQMRCHLIIRAKSYAYIVPVNVRHAQNRSFFVVRMVEISARGAR